MLEHYKQNYFPRLSKHILHLPMHLIRKLGGDGTLMFMSLNSTISKTYLLCSCFGAAFHVKVALPRLSRDYNEFAKGKVI